MWVRVGVTSCLALAALFVSSPRPVAAAISVECGQISNYTAPDNDLVIAGSLAIGLFPPWSIAPSATVSVNVAANLPGLVGAAPSCFAIETDGIGQVVALDFAGEGVISGPVVFDAGLPGYVFADRLFIPTFVTDAYPGLAAVFGASAVAGTTATSTFFVDTTSGQLTGIDATAAFCGPGDLDGDGDGLVGDATIPAVLLDAEDADALAGADLRETCADVRAFGTVGGNEGIVIETNVDIDVDAPLPTPPDTATESAVAATPPPSAIGYLALLALALLGLSAAARRRSE